MAASQQSFGRPAVGLDCHSIERLNRVPTLVCPAVAATSSDRLSLSLWQPVSSHTHPPEPETSRPPPEVSLPSGLPPFSGLFPETDDVTPSPPPLPESSPEASPKEEPIEAQPAEATETVETVEANTSDVPVPQPEEEPRQPDQPEEPNRPEQPEEEHSPAVAQQVAEEEEGDSLSSLTDEMGVEQPPPARDRFHVLGADPRATYMAHMLAGLSHDPSVRMILPLEALRKWHAGDRTPWVERRGKIVAPQKQVFAELLSEPTDTAVMAATSEALQLQPERRIKPRHRHIDNLIVTMSCARSIDAIRRLRYRIDHCTTICLLQQGLGVAERLNELFFIDPATRPRYVLGHMSHSLGYHVHSFTVTELMPGNLRLTYYEAQGPEHDEGEETADQADQDQADQADQDQADQADQQADQSEQVDQLDQQADQPDKTYKTPDMVVEDRRLVRLLGLTPQLGAGGYPVGDFLRWKLPDMMHTAVIEPLATVLDLSPESLWQNGVARGLVQGLVREMVAVVERLPETQTSEQLTTFVRSGALARQVLQLRARPHDEGRGAHERQQPETYLYQGYTGSRQRRPGSRAPRPPQPAVGWCEMATKVARGRTTDIQFLNGWFVRRGREVGIPCPYNEMVIHMVRAKQETGRARADDYVPLVDYAPQDAPTPAGGDLGMDAGTDTDPPADPEAPPRHWPDGRWPKGISPTLTRLDDVPRTAL